jgi:hypothetical protein
MTSFYCNTRFYQNEIEYCCSWDLTATKGDPTEEETIEHLAAILSENDPATWNLEEDEDEDDYPSTPILNLHGLSPENFARELVLNEKESQNRFGVTWEIWTRWEEVDPDNWEHPCNL